MQLSSGHCFICFTVVYEPVGWSKRSDSNKGLQTNKKRFCSPSLITKNVCKFSFSAKILSSIATFSYDKKRFLSTTSLTSLWIIKHFTAVLLYFGEFWSNKYSWWDFKTLQILPALNLWIVNHDSTLQYNNISGLLLKSYQMWWRRYSERERERERDQMRDSECLSSVVSFI